MMRLNEALADRERAVEIDPRNPDAYIARGGSCSHARETNKGLSDRALAITLAPDSEVAYAARSNAYFLLGLFDRQKRWPTC